MALQRLALFDLDNTLIDRAALFRGWGQDFLQRHGLDASEIAWLVEQDGDGLIPKDAFFAVVRSRFGLEESAASLEADYYERYPTFTVPPSESTLQSLGLLREHGWALGIVTNGPPMQEAVVDHAGVRHLFDSVCVSAMVGLRKPDPMIFQMAAEQCGAGARGNWMVGDSTDHDIAGARASGMRSCWIARGRTWQASTPEPDITTDSVADGVSAMLLRSHSPLTS